MPSYQVVVKDCLPLMNDTLPEGSVDLVVSSPPYNLEKVYETKKPMEEYLKWAREVVKALARVVKKDGAVCWQIGNWVNKKEKHIIPLDCLYIPIFQEFGFHLKNRIIWRIAHGLHSKYRLSPRYEVVLWFVKDPKDFCFNLDEIRIPANESAKRATKGPNKGAYSGHPLGKNPGDVWDIMVAEWEEGIWDLPVVNAGHPDKVPCHPCQFPTELAERCVLAFSDPGDTVLDPFAGVGTTVIASIAHGRKCIGVEMYDKFADIAKERIEKFLKGELRTRQIGTPIKHKKDNYPPEWTEIMREHLKKPRLVPSPNEVRWSEEIESRQPLPKKRKAERDENGDLVF
jgi:DNA modification methylase